MSAGGTAAASAGETLSWLEWVFPGLCGDFERVYPDAPCVAHGDVARFDFADDERLRSPALTIAASPCPPLHTAFSWEGAGGRQRRCASDEALSLFREGYTISLEAGGRIHDGLIQLASGLAAELGLERVITPAISVSPAGVGTPVHFDGLEVMILQIAGRKRWRYAPNASVEAADFPFFPGERGPGIRGGQGSAEQELAPPPSSEFHSCVLQPGSVLFLPRGWWHETRALEDSISATVRLPLDTRYSAVASEIARRLRQRAPWRRVLASAGGDGARQRPSAAAIDALVAQALTELSAAPATGASTALPTGQAR